MTEMLARAITVLENLPPSAQDAIAALILEELAEVQLWDDAFARTQDGLARAAERARSDIRAGRIRDGGWDVV